MCFFSLQITNNTRLRRTILQFLQIFFTEAWTFISFLPNFRAGGISPRTRFKPPQRNSNAYRRTTPERPYDFRLAFFIRLSYWCEIRCAWTCAMKSMITTTTINTEVPPK